MNKRDEGFTLIELLIVIVILGILAAVVVFAVGGITGDSETNACEAEKRAVETAVEAYRAREGSLPTSLGVLTAAGSDQLLRSNPTYWTVTAAGALSGVGTLPTGCA